MNATYTFALLGLMSLTSLVACDRGNDATPAGGDATTAKNTTTTGGADTTPSETSADNTARNKADQSGNTKTPLDQSESAASIKITADIRRAIMDDDAMSVNAQNCKIITDKAGVVTLRGVVNSQVEKDSIQVKAEAIAGVTRVDNQLEVKSS